jgi:TOMM system kinase/cyclase fusion protein
VIGQTVGHYRVLERLGEGGMGVVYKAEDLHLQRVVALKFIRPGREQKADSVVRFRREARAAAALNHPNIVTIYEIGEHEGRIYIAMEFVAGRSLAHLLARGPLPLPRALDLIAQVGDALGKAHQKGVVHRDIKPENVLVDEDGRVKILDFGLAKLLGAASTTETGTALGTLAYMPPEQAQGRPTDHRADIWAMAVMLYEMITGARPFVGDSPAGVVHAVLTQSPRSLSAARPGAPAELDRIFGRALAKDPGERYASPVEMVAELKAIDVSRAPAPAGLPRQPVDSQSPTRAVQGVAVEPPSERRPLSVLAWSVSGSRTDGRPTDPEDLEAALLAFGELCDRVVKRYEGKLNPPHLVYFGYPRAHEDDPRRAVLAALAILEGVKHLNAQADGAVAIRLSVRLGVHTGLVVAKSEPGRSSELPAHLVGDAPSLALRLAGLARPGSLLVSASTERLLEGLFECRSGPELADEGSPSGSATAEVLHESVARSRLDSAVARRGLTPLAGRDKELAVLLDRWQQAMDGGGQVLLLSGEPGIGKSRLALELSRRVADDPSTWMIELHCSPYHKSSAFHPIIDVLERVVLQFERGDPPERRIDKLEGFLAQYGLPLDEAVPLFAGLLSIPVGERYGTLALTPERQKQKMLAAMVQIVLSRAAEQPVLFVVEDLHWADPSTLEFIQLLIEGCPAAAILVLLTCRPEFVPSWAMRSHFASLPLTRLGPSECAAVVAGASRGRELSPELRAQIVARTDGVPLFVEEVTKMAVEASATASQMDIPTTLQASLSARLDAVGPAKEVAQLAAVLGREFSHEWLRKVATGGEQWLQDGLARLQEAELLYRRGRPPRVTYQFKHALIEEAAYQSLPRDKRQAVHRRAAETLAEAMPEIRASSPELLAHHFTAAGLPAQALPCWLEAGSRAMQRSANAEAATHLRRGLELLAPLPDDGARAAQELPFQMNLGLAVMMSRGYAAPETEDAFLRARALCRQLGDPPPTFPVLHGLFRYHLVRAEYDTAGQLGRELAAMAEQSGSPDLLVEACWAQATVFFWTGELTQARRGLERALTFYDPEAHRTHTAIYGQDPKVATLSYLGWLLAILGWPEQGLARVREAVRLARTIDHPFSLGFALHCTSIVHQLRRDVPATIERTEEQIAICTELGFPFWASGGRIIHGWALVESGRREEGASEMEQGLSGWLATGAELAHPYYLHMIADAHRSAGRIGDGSSAAARGLALAQNTGEQQYVAELHRLTGELQRLAAPDDTQPAEASFGRALEVARRQEAAVWELRAAASLARLWRGSLREQEGREALARARALLHETADTPEWRELTEGLDA